MLAVALAAWLAEEEGGPLIVGPPIPDPPRRQLGRSPLDEGSYGPDYEALFGGNPQPGRA